MQHIVVVDEKAEQILVVDDANPVYPGKFVLEWYDMDSNLFPSGPSCGGNIIFSKEELMKLADFTARIKD